MSEIDLKVFQESERWFYMLQQTRNVLFGN